MLLRMHFVRGKIKCDRFYRAKQEAIRASKELFRSLINFVLLHSFCSLIIHSFYLIVYAEIIKFKQFHRIFHRIYSQYINHGFHFMDHM